MRTAVATAAPSIAAIEQGLVRYVERSNPDRPFHQREHMYASAKRECDRRAVLEATNPEAAFRPSPEVKARFMRGDDRERDIRIQLDRAGQLSTPSFQTVGAQERVEIHDREGRMIIAGKIDFKFAWETRDVWPAENKSWSPVIVSRIEKFADVFDSPWTRAGAYQLLAYLYSTNSPVGVLVLDTGGFPKLIEVRLEDWLDEMEGFVQQAERVNAAIRAGELPGFHHDPTICRRCDLFGNVCNPPSVADGADVVVDDELIAQAEELVELQDGARRYEKLAKGLKARLRGHEGLTLIGNVVAEGKWKRGKTLNIPDAMKKRHEGRVKRLKAFEAPFVEEVAEKSFELRFRKIEEALPEE